MQIVLYIHINSGALSTPLLKKHHDPRIICFPLLSINCKGKVFDKLSKEEFEDIDS